MKEKKIPVMLLKDKARENRYLALGFEYGDHSDQNLDVTIQNVENAFVIVRNDYTPPTLDDLERIKEESLEHKKRLIEEFGPNAMVSYDVEKWLKTYEPKVVEITVKQYNKVAINNDWRTI